MKVSVPTRTGGEWFAWSFSWATRGLSLYALLCFFLALIDGLLFLAPAFLGMAILTFNISLSIKSDYPGLRKVYSLRPTSLGARFLHSKLASLAVKAAGPLTLVYFALVLGFLATAYLSPATTKANPWLSAIWGSALCLWATSVLVRTAHRETEVMA
jgi:hypothetical protein